MATNTFKKEVLALNTKKVFLTALVINHPDWANSLYLIDDVIPITIGGQVYTPYGFKFAKHASNVSGNKTTKLRIEDVDRQIAAQVLSVETIKTPITITISVILADNPEVVELGPFDYEIQNMSQAGTMLTFTLVKNTILQNRLSGFTFSSEYFPGLFL